MPETQALPPLPGILAEIVATKRREVEALLPGARELERAAADAPPTRGFERALRRLDTVAVIAECKRRSPGAGDIRGGLEPGRLAAGYEGAGAAALSVLTDEEYFGGSADDLRAARAATDLPVLRKDFTIHEVQLLEARAMGADAVLLIVRILDDETLGRLYRFARDLQLDVLVETHDAEELVRATELDAAILGINNRDLATFTTDLETTLQLLEHVPRDAVVVSESGIRTRDDVARLGAAGVDAVLVGEALLRAPDPGAAAAALCGQPRRTRVR